MSSHEIFIQCDRCKKLESLYTGNLLSYQFDDEDWEGEFITVQYCIDCKIATQPAPSVPGRSSRDRP